ncbi:MAG: N-acetylmuramoyl-L-alanine amidase [Lachnospiraceae bacterium]|nr:N-acetylmuramoyl-L-alanine amidase [Lachnospiraceae bacterium]
MTAVSALPAHAAENLLDPGEDLVVVIDPGHGGENLGTEEGKRLEKEMTLITAQALADELRQFEGITVYLTRTEDVDLSLEDRAQFAKDVGADFLFSIHYNASLNHNLYGSEVWVPLSSPYNAYGFQFGQIQMESMKEMGLYLRGIKTRTGQTGEDYYGILRFSTALGVPSALIEHAHVDQPEDAALLETEDQLRAFGVADAHSIARYFGLRSEALGLDYTGEAGHYAEAEKNGIQKLTLEDTTDPEHLQLSFSSANYTAGKAGIQVVAADRDGMLLYYDYSMDGGQTFSALMKWPEADPTTGSYKQSFYLDLDFGKIRDPEVIVRVYNQYDRVKESETFTFTQSFGEEPTDPSDVPPGKEDANGPEQEKPDQVPDKPQGSTDPAANDAQADGADAGAQSADTADADAAEAAGQETYDNLSGAEVPGQETDADASPKGPTLPQAPRMGTMRFFPLFHAFAAFFCFSVSFSADCLRCLVWPGL